MILLDILAVWLASGTVGLALAVYTEVKEGKDVTVKMVMDISFLILLGPIGLGVAVYCICGDMVIIKGIKVAEKPEKVEKKK